MLDSKLNHTREETDMKWDKNVVQNVIFLFFMRMYDVRAVLVS